jgi:sporulation protein YlmC with PRC-barrel domain
MCASQSGFAQTVQNGESQNFVTAQLSGQWLASLFIGQPVTNDAGERIGDVNDLLFDQSGRVTALVIGVGGFLGIGEKNVAVPFSTATITAAPDGKRVLMVPLSAERLKAAPEFQPSEKTIYMKAVERARQAGQAAVERAEQWRQKAMKKMEDVPSVPRRD